MDGPLVILPALFGSIIWLTYIIVDGFRRRQQLRVTNEFHNKLLDRIGSASEFVEFFNSEGGARFIGTLSPDRAAPSTRIVSAVQWGITMLSLGVAIFVLVGNRQFREETVDTLTFLATVAAGLGAGMVLSALASYVIGRRMGILSDKK
jgi:hypothetical protein